MAVLESTKEPAYIKETAVFLREEAPEVVADATDEEIHKLVGAGIAQTRRHGIDDVNCIRQFILFMAWCGPDFDQETWASEILADRDSSQQSKISRLEDHILSAQEGE